MKLSVRDFMNLHVVVFGTVVSQLDQSTWDESSDGGGWGRFRLDDSGALLVWEDGESGVFDDFEEWFAGNLDAPAPAPDYSIPDLLSYYLWLKDRDAGLGIVKGDETWELLISRSSFL